MRTTLVVLGLTLVVGGSAGCGKSEAQEQQPRHPAAAGAEGDPEDQGDAGAEAGGDGGADAAHEAAGEGHEGAEASGSPEAGGVREAEALSPALATMQAANALGEMLRTNALFVHEHRPSYFADFRDQQSPRATLLACADSRFHVGAVDATADGDVFEVRNIGNQVDSGAASVIYGVRHLHTPLLVIVGHVGCGAVRAAMDHGHLEAPVQAEVDRLAAALGPPAERRDSTDPWLDAVVRNVHRQVARAVELFRAEVDGGTLHVVGAVYDFRDDLHRGQGRAVVIDVNGSDVPEASPLLQLVLSSEPVDDAVAGAHERRDGPVSP